jgi:indolepyruvate ferredoxin oxidoreductase
MGINQGPISLDQKYTQESGHVFLTGIQALVRLPMAQIRRDRAAGLKTAGFISGYRGHRDLGLATAQSVARRPARWRRRHLVRQGPGRRPLR